MKTLLLLITLAFATAGAYANACHSKELAKSAAQPEEDKIYNCPMHPEIRQDEPGDCPKCGMYLVPSQEESHNHSN